MFMSRFGGLGEDSCRDQNLAAVTEIILKAMQDLHSINKELKYSNWLKMIELKSKGLYDEKQLKQDLEHFGLEL